MKSTMQDFPLTVAAILRHGTAVHADRNVRTRRPDGTVRRATFSEIGVRAAQLANALRGAGIGSQDRVATFMWNNQEHVEAYAAVPAMGAVLHTINIRLACDQFSYIANHAEDQIVITDANLAHLLAPALGEMTTVHTVVVTGDDDLSALEGSGKRVVRYEEFIAGQPTAFDWPELDERAPAAMCYTSGTTGHPKGVVYSHRSTYLHSMAVCTKGSLEVGPEDVVLPIVPMFHANAWGMIYAAIMAGADLLLPDRYLQAEALTELIHTERPTIAGAVPTVWSDIAQYLDAHPDRDLASLRLVVCGGSAAPSQLMKHFERTHGIHIVQAWGMTETSPLAAVARPPSDVDAETHWRLRASQGRPLCGVEARIVDDGGVPLPHDGLAVGELQVRGPWITAGYYGRDDAVCGPDGWMSTGDVGSIDSRQFIRLTDRSKDVIKSGGEWISSVQLELTIATHPAVLEAAVIAVPDSRWQERPLAAVAIRDGHTVTARELRDFLGDKVARWWIPERWTFVDQIPRTSVGKYDKKVLRSAYAREALSIVAV